MLVAEVWIYGGVGVWGLVVVVAVLLLFWSGTLLWLWWFGLGFGVDSVGTLYSLILFLVLIIAG